jgi:hypothetical protein
MDGIEGKKEKVGIKKSKEKREFSASLCVRSRSEVLPILAKKLYFLISNTVKNEQ